MTIRNLLDNGQFAVRDADVAEARRLERLRESQDMVKRIQARMLDNTKTAPTTEQPMARGGVGWVNGKPVDGDAPPATPPEKLEDVLRASVAREENRKMAHEDLYAAIEKRRTELLEDLLRHREKRTEVNELIRRCQDALDMLPVPKRRHSKKVELEELTPGLLTPKPGAV